MSKVVPIRTVEKAREKAAKPAPNPYQWTCKRCEHDLGVATSEIVETIIAPRIQGVKIKGGTKRYQCFPCRLRGITTKVLL